MIKSHQIKVYPTKSQERLFRQSCGVARFAFNWALNKWQEDYKDGIKQSAYSLIKYLNSIKKTEFPWMQKTGKTCSQYAIHNVESAYKKMWKEKSGYPKFKKKGVKDSFVAVENKQQFKQKDFKIWIPRIGWIKCAENLRFYGKVNNVVVKRIADLWFAVVNIEVTPNEIPAVNENQITAGVDLGIKSMIVLSDGTIFENPKALRNNLKSLKRLQRGLTRKSKGSANRKKQQIKIARKHYRISSIRKNAIHQATSYIVNNYSKIIIEDLNVKGMIKNKKLSQAIIDVSFGELARQLSYKAQWAGKSFVKADRFFASSKTCSNCGCKKEKLKLSERIFKCGNCGLKIDRDLNAAKNLANYGSTSKYEEREACGVSNSSSEEKKRGIKKQEINKLSNKFVQKCASS
jgi:putative transposase